MGRHFALVGCVGTGLPIRPNMSRASTAFVFSIALGAPLVAGAELGAGTVLGDGRLMLGWLMVAGLCAVLWRSGARRPSDVNADVMMTIKLFAFGLVCGAAGGGAKLLLAHFGT